MSRRASKGPDNLWAVPLREASSTDPGRPCLRLLQAAAEAEVHPTELLARSRHACIHATERAGTPVVLKILTEPADPLVRRRFAREGSLGLGLRHPSLVETLRYGKDWILLADLRGLGYRGGRTLSEGLRDEPDAAWLPELGGIAAALAYLHARGLVHRDVKPGNILSGSARRLMLVDLGALGLVSGDDLGLDEIIGSPAWMAPEQALGSRSQPSADIYSLALVFAFALVRRPAFVGSADYVLQHRQDGGGPLEDFLRCVEAIPDTVTRQLIQAGLSEIPSERPPAEAFVQLAAAFEA